MGALFLVVAFGLVLHLRPGGESALRAIDDLAECGIAVAAAGCCVWRALRVAGRSRVSWLLLAGATGGWATGNGVWSYFELLSSRATPFPSLADVGYLAFPALALPALLLRPSAAFSRTGRARLVLDGTMVAASVLNLSWATSLGAVYRAGGDNRAALIVGLAYPISDVVILTVAVLVLAQARVRSGLIAFSAGLLAMAVADSAFSYMTAAGTYRTGSYIDVAWFAAFVLIGLSALTAHAEDSVADTEIQSPKYLALPYALIAGGIAAAIISISRPHGDRMALLIAAIALAAILMRQFLTLLDNRHLIRSVAVTQGELRHRAFHDALTGLANRALFYDRVEHALELHRRDKRSVSVLLCDLDDFKAVNDTLGHGAGDTLLVAVSARLLATARDGDTVARLGGDEFGILIEDDGDAASLADRLLEAFALPVSVAGRAIPVRASIGVTSVDAGEPPIDSAELIRRVDVAMYAAKRSGKGTALPYHSLMSDQPAYDLDLQLALARDIAGGQIRTAFQPIFSADGDLRGYEALARWTYRGAPVTPAVFVPVADRAGLLPDLDLLVIRNAIRWAAQAEHRTFVTANIGVTHLPDPRLPDRIAYLLDEYGLAAERLVVEVPENHDIDEAGAPRTLAALRRLGVKIALDDFGVGYSTLSRLDNLRPDIVKLDRSFVIPFDDPSASQEFLGGIVDLAHRLGAIVVAEGIETEQQRATLTALGCDAFQGFLLGRPTEMQSDSWSDAGVMIGSLPSA